MNLLNTKFMLGIASVALGISLMVATYVFTGGSDAGKSMANSKAADQEVVLLVEESPFMDKCMVTNVEQFAGIYATPSEAGTLLGKMFVGSCADVLKKGETWTKISSGTVIGYVNNNYLVFDKEAEVFANQTCKWIATVNADALNVRSEPSLEAGVLGLAYLGEVYDIVAMNSGWVTIQFQDETGYLSETYLVIKQNIRVAMSLEEEAAAIAAEQARLAAIAAEEARIAAENEARRQAAIAGSKFTEVIQTSPYSISEADAYLLACLVDCEAGYEPYDGKLAVANVVLNRFNYGANGNTIEGVIYARNQFSVVGETLTNKLINGPRQESIDATKAALSGINNMAGYYSFISIGAAQYETYSSYTIINNHVFYNR